MTTEIVGRAIVHDISQSIQYIVSLSSNETLPASPGGRTATAHACTVINQPTQTGMTTFGMSRRCRKAQAIDWRWPPGDTIIDCHHSLN